MNVYKLKIMDQKTNNDYSPAIIIISVYGGVVLTVSIIGCIMNKFCKDKEYTPTTPETSTSYEC